jgi:phosphoribosyl 1,2-cyclic phosphate phosphodiesterase
MQVTLLGAGDTTGTPTPGCGCDTCERARDPDEELRRRLHERGVDVARRGRVERSRFSVHVAGPDGCLLIDASPDFRYQFLAADVTLPDAVVVTHVHFDHLDGLGNAYRLLSDVPVYAADETDPETGESVAETIARRYDYLDAVDVHPETPGEPFEAVGLSVELVPVVHPPLLCYGVAVSDPETGGMLALTGDTSFGIPAASREALSGADLLLTDGIVPADLCEYHPKGGSHPDEEGEGVYRTFGTKHMTIEGARAMGEELGADRTRVVHTAHYTPSDVAFEEDIAVDGERYLL